MPEPSWKEQTYWSAIFCTFLATLILAGFIGSRWQHEQPEAVRYELRIIHEPAPVEQRVMPSEYESLETRQAIQAIELQTAKEIFNSGRDPFEQRWK